MENHIKNYTVLNIIGEGASSTVYLAQSCQGKTFIVKEMKPIGWNSDSDHTEEFQKEIQILKQLDHPNIVKYYNHSADNTMIFLEYLPNGLLLDYLMNYELPTSLQRYYFIQIVQAVQQIHSQNIANSDLKLENILFDENFNIKIVDFGVSYQTPEGQSNSDTILTNQVGSQTYKSPQIHDKKYNPFQADIFALGVILFTIVFNTFPFQFAKKIDQSYNYFIEGKEEEFWEKKMNQFNINSEIDQDLKALINGLMSYKENERLNFDQIFQNKWLQGEQLDEATRIKTMKKI